MEPTTVTVTEGDTGRKTVCLSMSNAAIPVNVTFSGEYSGLLMSIHVCVCIHPLGHRVALPIDHKPSLALPNTLSLTID